MSDVQEIGEQRRQALGIDGTMGDAQDVPHVFDDADRGVDYCVVCGLSRTYRMHTGSDRGEHPAWLPAVLSSVEEAALVFEAAGLREITEPEALAAIKQQSQDSRNQIRRTWQDRDMRISAYMWLLLRVKVEAFGSAGDWFGDGRQLRTSVVWAAIQAARSESDRGSGDARWIREDHDWSARETELIAEAFRLRARVAELETAGDEMASAKNWVSFVVEAQAWRAVRAASSASDARGER